MAVGRRARQELDLSPVYLATKTDEPIPNPDEVIEYTWTDPAALRRAVRDAPWAFSPWLARQPQELEAVGA